MADLASKLQKALLHNQIRLNPVDPQPAMGYVSSVLFDDNEENEREMIDFLQQTGNRSYSDLLTELSSIVSQQQQPLQQEHKEDATVAMEDVGFPKLCSMLLECAQAVAANNSTEVYRKVDTIQRLVPPSSSSHRLALHFLQALGARLTGSGLQAHRALEAKTVQQYRLLCSRIPTNKVTYLFACEMILERCRGAKQVHIVDYGIFRGQQWPCLLRAFSERIEGPPLLRITGIEFPHIESFDIGNKLMQYAAFLGIHLQYKSIASSSWETVSIATEVNEVLIVNCNLRMRHLKHDGTSVNSHRNMLFSKIHSLRPKMFLLSDLSANLSTPFFLPRFQEALRYYSACAEYYSAYVKDEVKPLMEEILASKIMNVVACEGLDRYERATSYENWGSAVRKAGFQQLALSSGVYSGVRNLLGHFEQSQNLGTAVDGNWLLVGWKDVLLYAMCAWQPCPP